MRRKGRGVTEAELAVLQLLWTTAEMTARELVERLYPSGNSSDVATVQKLLQRLESKGLVLRDRTAHAHTFSAAIPRHEFAGEQLAEMAEKLSDGSLTPLLVHLVESNQLTAAERAEIRRLLNRHK